MIFHEWHYLSQQSDKFCVNGCKCNVSGDAKSNTLYFFAVTGMDIFYCTKTTCESTTPKQVEAEGMSNSTGSTFVTHASTHVSTPLLLTCIGTFMPRRTSFGPSGGKGCVHAMGLAATSARNHTSAFFLANSAMLMVRAGRSSRLATGNGFV